MSRALSSLPEHKLIHMPALSPTMEVGTIQEWKKREGDAIEGGEVIAEIETDKATRSYEYNDDGYMARVRYLSICFLQCASCCDLSVPFSGRSTLADMKVTS